MKKYFWGNNSGISLLWSVMAIALYLMIISSITIIIIAEIHQAKQIDGSVQAYMAAEVGYERVKSRVEDENPGKVPTTDGTFVPVDIAQGTGYSFHLVNNGSEDLPDISPCNTSYCFSATGDSSGIRRKLVGRFQNISDQESSTIDLSTWDSDITNRIFPYPGDTSGPKPQGGGPYLMGGCLFPLWAPKSCQMLRRYDMAPPSYISDPTEYTTVILQGELELRAGFKSSQETWFQWGLFNKAYKNDKPDQDPEAIWGKGINITMFGCMFEEFCRPSQSDSPNLNNDGLDHRNHLIINIRENWFYPNRGGADRIEANWQNFTEGVKTGSVDLGEVTLGADDTMKLRYTLRINRGSSNINEHTAILKVDDITVPSSPVCKGINTINWPNDDLPALPLDLFVANGYDNIANGYSVPATVEDNALKLQDSHCDSPTGQDCLPGQQNIYLKNFFLQIYKR